MGNRNRAVIVASGPSAEGFDPPPGLTVFAVNGAIDWIPRADYWFSLDASTANSRRYMRRHTRPETHYAIAGPLWAPLLPRTWINTSHWKRVDSLNTYDEPAERGSPEWWLWRLGAVLGICKTPGCIHTGNSAWGALGLAYHLGYRDVALVGVDATTEDRVGPEGGRSKYLGHLPALFASALPDMNVVSCGKLNSVPQMAFKDWYENR